MTARRADTRAVRRSRRRRFVISIVLASAIVLVVTVVVARSRSSSAETVSFPDDGFINFEPSADMFPAPPVADAEIIFGFSKPEPWQWEPKYCPHPTLDYRHSGPSVRYPVDGLDFTGVRYDWSDAGAAKTWVINEQTIGFADDNKRDQYLDELSGALIKCGWEYDDKSGYGFNAVPVELPRLPEGSVAYRSEFDPRSDYSGSADRAFQAITVLVPGEQPNHLIVVVWIGWGTDVSAESAESVAAALAAEANAAGRALPGDEG